MLLIFNSTLHSKHGKITTKQNQTKENTFLSMYNKKIKQRTTRTQVIKIQIKEEL